MNTVMMCVYHSSLVLIILRYWNQIYSAWILECPFVNKNTSLWATLSENIFSKEEILTCLALVTCHCNNEEVLKEKICVRPLPILMP
jgi:hypothetical protein